MSRGGGGRGGTWRSGCARKASEGGRGVLPLPSLLAAQQQRQQAPGVAHAGTHAHTPPLPPSEHPPDHQRCVALPVLGVCVKAASGRPDACAREQGEEGGRAFQETPLRSRRPLPAATRRAPLGTCRSPPPPPMALPLAQAAAWVSSRHARGPGGGAAMGRGTPARCAALAGRGLGWLVGEGNRSGWRRRLRERVQRAGRAEALNSRAVAREPNSLPASHAPCTRGLGSGTRSWGPPHLAQRGRQPRPCTRARSMSLAEQQTQLPRRIIKVWVARVGEGGG